MKYKEGQSVIYKNNAAEIVFCFPKYKNGKNAYAIKYIYHKKLLHRLCFEDELCEQIQVNIKDLPF
jgi:hypothetical protein